MIIPSFLFFLLAFVLIGVSSAKHRQPSTADYLLASQDVKPWLVGLSFFATENSGFMFVGYIGMIYLQGVSAIWLAVGWYVGEVCILWWTGSRIRERTTELEAQTYSSLLSRWSGEEFVAVRRLSALVIMIFLGVYAAAQLSAGGKALHVLVGWDYTVSASVGFVIVLLYCYAGGIRASIWTDAAQALVMLVSLIVLVIVGLSHVGGYSELWTKLAAIDENLVRVIPENLKFGFLLYFLGWLFAGMGVLGQSHVMVRFMVIDESKHVRRALVYYFGMVVTLSALCLTVGLITRVLLPELATSDPELGLPTLSAALLPEVLTGLVLAGLFSAAISTADSQILSSSAALTRDLVPQYRDSYLWTKVGTVLVASIALGISVAGFTNVFTLVTFAWSVMAAGFAPLLFLFTIGKRPSESQALSMMLVGIVAAVLWKQLGYADHVYNVLPGIVAGLLTYGVMCLLPSTQRNAS